MITGRHPKALPLAVAWALAGVLGGHLLTYALLFPEAHLHDAMSAASGHGWTALLAPAVMTAILIAVALGLLGGTRQAGSRGVRFATLALMQVVLFGGLEVAERVGTGMTVDSLSHHLVDHRLAGILLLGSLVQLFTAWLGSAASRLVAAVARRLRVGPLRQRQARSFVPRAPAALPAAGPARAHRSRGPPPTVASVVPIAWGRRPGAMRRAPRRPVPYEESMMLFLSNSLRRGAAMLSATLLTVAVTAPALGHVTVPEGDVHAGSTAVVHFRIGHGCDGLPVDTVEIALPDGIVAAAPEYVPGWTLEVETVESEPYERFGETYTERVGVIRWSGGDLPDFAWFDFGVRATFLLDAGTVVGVPVVQRCGDAEIAWIEPVVEGEAEPEHPTPLITIVDAADEDHDH